MRVRRLTLWLAVLLTLAARTVPGAETVSKPTYDALAAARRAIDGGRPGEAIKSLPALVEATRGNPYERALAQQMLGYAYAGAGDLKSAAAAFRAALDSGRLPAGDAANLRYNLAQILINDGRDEEGLQYLEATGRTTRDAHALAAIAYQRTGNCRAAIPHLQVLAKEKGRDAAKWSQALVACQAKAGQYGAVAESLEAAVRANPDNTEAWLQLAAAYQRAHKVDRAIAAMEVPLARGALDGPRRAALARLYLGAGVPLKAARLLEDSMQSGALPRDREHQELLVDALLRAQEREQAAVVLEDMLKQNDDGELWYQLGRIQFERQQWAEASDSLQKAVASRTIKDVSGANLLLGIAAMQINQPQVAEQSLRIATGGNMTREQAEWWLQRLRRQQQPATEPPPPPMSEG